MMTTKKVYGIFSSSLALCSHLVSSKNLPIPNHYKGKEKLRDAAQYTIVKTNLAPEPFSINQNYTWA